MRITVDRDLCEGNGVCVLQAPTVFDLDDDDQAHVLIAQPSDDVRPSVIQAVNGCPKAAITMTG